MQSQIHTVGALVTNSPLETVDSGACSLSMGLKSAVCGHHYRVSMLLKILKKNSTAQSSV